METVLEIITALQSQGYLENLCGDHINGFYYENIPLVDASYEVFYVSDRYCDFIEAIAKVTSACGTIKGIAIY